VLCSLNRARNVSFSSCGQIGAILSMLHVMDMVAARERDRDEPFTWLLMRRLDLVQYTPITLKGLSSALFYASNNCGLALESERFVSSATTRLRCLRLSFLPYTKQQSKLCTGCVMPRLEEWLMPDFTFLASSANMHLVFNRSILAPAEQPHVRDFPPYVRRWMVATDQFLSLHAFLHWRLRHVGLGDSLGRFQYHLLDYTFLRPGFYTPCQSEASTRLNGSMWRSQLSEGMPSSTPSHGPATDLQQPRAVSHCDVPWMFCFCWDGSSSAKEQGLSTLWGYFPQKRVVTPSGATVVRTKNAAGNV